MNTEFISKSLRFHGQPLQKIWAGERGDHDLYQLGITNPDFSVYFERQKNLTFQDRAKRLKLHQFLARNAEKLYSRDLQSASVNTGSESTAGNRKDATDKIVPLPPYEYFLNTAGQEKSKVCHSTLDAVKPGDIVYGVITKPCPTGMQIKVLCTREPLVRYLADIQVKAQLPTPYMVPGYDKKGNPKNYASNLFVCCEVLEISVDADRMTLGMKGVVTKDTSAPLGLISPEQIPDYYRRIVADSMDYMEYLCSSKIFNNTNCYEILYQEVGLDINDTFSHMRSLKHRFPTQDYAIELRQTQASKWAFRSVADGIEHFKIGRHVEAFQCLNKALSIDPRNVEGLVARGALYANKGSFVKAVEDFETALKLNAFHTNARKYMGETLVALGRSYEEENQMEEAIKAYQNCLNIIPNHEQARISLDALMRRPGHAAPVIDINMLSIPGSSELKKKKKSKHKSSSSSSSTDGSSDSSSDSDSSGDSSDSGRAKQKKKNHKQKSLSPLSKRMGDMNAGNVGSSSFEFSQPFHMLQKEEQPDFNEMDDFLRAGAEDDYETRVQKLIRDASKHKKLREGKSSKKKSKKKKKKAKKEARLEKEKRTKQETLALENAFQKSPMDAIKLHQSLEKFEQSIMELSTFQKPSLTPDIKLTENEIIDLDNEEPPPAPSFNRAVKPRAESPVPPAPKSSKISIRLQNPGSIRSQAPPPAPAPAPATVDLTHQTRPIRFVPSYNAQEANSFKPFPIKAPVVLDKFGCFRLAVPVDEKSTGGTDRQRSRSPNKIQIYSRTNIHCRSKSHSRSVSRSRSSGRSRRRSKSNTRRRSKSLTRHGSKPSGSNGSKSRPRNARPRRSNSRSNRSRSRSNRSRSRSQRSRSRRRSRSRERRRSPRGGRRSPTKRRSRSRSKNRRSPSPFNPNRRARPGTLSRNNRRSSPSSNERKGSFANQPKKVFGNRVWQRPVDETKQSSRWDNKTGKNSPPTSSSNSSAPKSSSGIDGRWQHDKFVKEDGISLEEIDKIIIQAKKDRKEEILQRDKKILKKNPASSFL